MLAADRVHGAQEMNWSSQVKRPWGAKLLTESLGAVNPFELTELLGRATGDRQPRLMALQPASYCHNPWPRFDPSERSRATRASAHEPLFVAELACLGRYRSRPRAERRVRSEVRALPVKNPAASFLDSLPKPLEALL
jgi:hypothetical protein